MNRIIFYLAIAMLAPAMLLTSADPTRIAEEMEQIKLLDSSLSSGGIAKLFSAASRKSISAPKIPDGRH